MAHLGDRPITIVSADRTIFGAFDDRITFAELPDAIGHPSATESLHAQATPDVMHCMPLGSSRLRENAGLLADILTAGDVGLFVVDVSAEWSIFSRLCSVPSVTIRMHGERSDTGHVASYQASAGIVAPFSEILEQPDYPKWARRKTFYSGGLCTTTVPVPSKSAARKKLGLEDGRQTILAFSGGGGSGAHYASLTMGARALPDARWLTIGPLYKEGHETDFANLTECGWVENAIDYLAAADVVVASAGDNTVHEIARADRPFLCIPEWRYFDEQVQKAARLDHVAAVHTLSAWPASPVQWQSAIAAALARGTRNLSPLFDPGAAGKIGDYITDLDRVLWACEESTESDVAGLNRRLSLVG